MRITSIINGMVGVAKTSTAHALATSLNKGGYKVLNIMNYINIEIYKN